MKENIGPRESARVKREVVRIIRALHREGEPLDVHAVKRYHPHLIQKAYSVSPFWGWARAIADAGIDYRKINVDLLDKITCKFCGRRLGSLCSHLPRIHGVSSADYLEGGYDESILNESTRARVSRALISNRDLIHHWEPIWSPEYVLDRTLALHRLKFPLNSKYIFAKEKGLMTQSLRYFGSWDAVLRRVGLSPEDIRLVDRRVSSTKEEVIRQLRKRQDMGRPLNNKSVYDDDMRLMNACCRRFGSFSKALRAAGIDPDKVRRTRTPYREAERRRFLNAVRRVAATPQKRRLPEIRALRKRYDKIVVALYGRGWKKIAREAGIPYDAIHPKSPRDYGSRKKVIAALNQRLKAGMSVDRSTVKDNRTLYQAVLRYFPKYYDCYPVIGLRKYAPPVRRHYATAENVLSAIRKRDAMNLGVRLADLWKGPMKGRDYYLGKRGIEIFGSWSKTLDAADIAKEKRGPGKLPSYPTPEAVLEEIRRRRRKGLPLERWAVERGTAGHKYKDRMLVELARRYFKTWETALNKAFMIGK
jgi:hypothetical protein